MEEKQSAPVRRILSKHLQHVYRRPEPSLQVFFLVEKKTHNIKLCETLEEIEANKRTSGGIPPERRDGQIFFKRNFGSFKTVILSKLF